MNRETKIRFGWVKLYLETADAGFVCRRCGISRPTLRKLIRRYKDEGISGLSTRSRRPQYFPNLKIFEQQENWILELRNKRKLGARRIQSELLRLYDFRLSLATIHKVLTRNGVKPFKRKRRKKDYRRYEKSIPGERVQVDTFKVAKGLF